MGFLEQLKKAAQEAFNSAVENGRPKEEVDKLASVTTLADQALDEKAQQDKDYKEMLKAYSAAKMHSSYEPKTGPAAGDDIAPAAPSFDDFIQKAINEVK